MVVEAPDYISNLPNECFSVVFQSLSYADRKRYSLVCHRWRMIEGQSPIASRSTCWPISFSWCRRCSLASILSPNSS
ncbi:unnamed protein product [Linum tenue]|uniref:F-box domain-containing protein n=1 Tax=Linum tenue TaxID=586396 RepID=A0AAV0MJ92_9ROSI|nr:unnamed protein product [Linum tenue]